MFNFAPSADRVQELLNRYRQQGGVDSDPSMRQGPPPGAPQMRPYTPNQDAAAMLAPGTATGGNEMPADAAFQPAANLTPNTQGNGLPLDGEPSTGIMANMAPQMRPSQVTANAINDVLQRDYSIKKNKDGTVIRGKDRDTDYDAKDVFGGAGLGALDGLQRGGIIGAIIGAFKGATDRNTTEKYHDQQVLGRLTPRYQMQAAMESNDQTYDTKEQQNANAKTTEETRIAQLNLNIQKELYDQLSDQQKTEAEKLQWEPQVRNGKYYKHFTKTGKEEPLTVDGKQEVELTKVPVETALEGGTKVFTSGDEAVRLETSRRLEQARLDVQAGRSNADAFKDFEKSTADWVEKTTTLKTNGQAKIDQADALESGLSGLDPESTRDAQTIRETKAKAAGLRAEGKAMMQQSKSLMRPKRPTAANAPNLTPKVVPKSKDPYNLFQQ